MALRSALDNFRNFQTFVLAIVVIGAFLIFYGITLVYSLIMPHICQNCNSYEGLEKVTSTLGPIVAAIIGYYFGQRPIQRLARDAQQAASERDKYRRDYAETLDTDITKTEKIQRYEEQINSLKIQLESLKSQLNPE
jgi:hypothetical protein